MSLRFPLMWEVFNLVLIIAKGFTFLHDGAPFQDAWLLLGLCAASVALELVGFDSELRSAGTLPRQHVFLHSAVGAMATMNLAEKRSWAPIPATTNTILDQRRLSEGYVLACETTEETCYDGESGEDIAHGRQNSFEERRRFLSDWNTKVDKLRATWKTKVDELAEKLAAARRNRNRRWGGAEGSRGGAGGGGGGGGGWGAPLLLLARMFAQEQAAIEELGDMWVRDPKWTGFFLPQYTLFLLYASFAHSSRLQDLLLDRCGSSVQTAHALYWFLRAFCLQGARVTPEGVTAIEQMLQEVVSRGEQPARDFCELRWRDDGDAVRYSELFDAPDEGAGGNRSLSGRFGETVEFVDELVKISTELAGVGKERRTEELKSRLREVQARFLPSRAIYIPLNRRRHRVYRIAVEESFSFSTKDRAPYLVTLEVLDSRLQQQQQQQQQQRPPLSSGSERPGAGASGSADGAAGRAKGRGEGEEGGGAVKVGLIRMLTPKGLGQSLREMADNTLTSLKLGGSTKDGRGGGVASGSSSGGDDVESQPPMVVPPSGGGDFLSKGPMAAPASGGGRGGGGASEAGVVSGRSLSLLLQEPAEKEGDAKGGGGARGGGGDDALTVAATLSNSSGSAVVMPTVSDAAVHAASAAATTGSSNSSPPSPAAWSVFPRPCSSEAAAAMLSRDDSAAEEAGTEAAYSQPPDQVAVVAVAEGVGRRKDGGGKVPVSGGERDESRDRGGKGGASNGIGCGDGVQGGSIGGTAGGSGVSTGEGGDGEEGEGEEEIAQRLVPPSFSSTNLMGMWSRPSKRMAEQGQVPFSSPTSPNPFFSNSPAVSINDIAATTPAAATSVENASSAAGPDGSGPAGAGSGGGDGSLRRGGGSDRRLSGEEEEIVDGPSSVAGTVTPARPPWVSSETMAVAGEGTPAAAPSPGTISVGSTAGDGVEALLLVIFKERWHQKEARLRRASKLGQAREWRLMPVIVKAGDDLRQEQLASQFFALAHRILKQSPLRARAGLRPYDIVATSHDAGIIEAIPDTVSIDALKKNDPLYTTLLDFFHRHFGPPKSEGFQRARRFFVESLAANCIVTYLLQVKDRHNGNILLDARGRVIHIDFGFMLANSPGGNFNFESAPFKLTAEFVDLMGGPSSACFKGFREVCVQTFMELRRKMPRLILLLETSSVGNAHLPCFGGRPEAVVAELRARFKPEAHDRAAMAHVHRLIDRSMGCWRTSWYDLYQSFAVGIAK
ncbi:unnamed protein product [Ectocarpus sp. CCAP 1310/34]|nr:unnamed protein product [Ectocarpus sp. CCAP 1310/34]